MFLKIFKDKKFLAGTLGIAVLVLGFWLIWTPKAEASVYTKTNSCPGSSELECYNDTAGDSGYTGCLSSVECCLACNSYKSTCAITDTGSDYFTEEEFNAGGTGSCSDTSVLSCKSGNRTGSCPNTSSYNGKQCIVRKIDPSNSNNILYNNSNTYWDGPNKRCIACGSWIGPTDGLTRNNTELSKCGDTSGVYLDSSGNCNGTSLDQFKFKAICGADAACDGKAYPDNGVAPSCTGGTCNLSGACEAAATCSGSVSLTLNPSTVSLSGSVTPSAAGLTSCNGKGVSFRESSCAGTEKSTCTIPAAGTGCTGGSFTAPSTAGTYTYYACVDKNSDSDYSDSGEQGSAPLTVVSCPAGFSVSFGSGAYSKTDNFRITYTSSDNFCTEISRVTGGHYVFWDEDTLDGVTSRTNYDTGVSGGSYVSTGNVVRATINNSLTCDYSASCKAEITIVECTKNSDCSSNDCNLTTNTCNLAETPCSDPTKYVTGTVYVSGSPITTGSTTVSCPSCSYIDSIVAGDGGNYSTRRSTTIGEVCTVTAVSSNPCGNSSSTSFTVSASNPSIDFNLGPCAAAGPTCAAGDGCVAVGCTPPDPDCVTGPAILLNPLKCTDIVCLIDLVVNFIFYLALPIAVLMIIIAAFLFMTAGGEPQKLASARSIILYTLIGLLVIILAKGLAAALKYALGAK